MDYSSDAAVTYDTGISEGGPSLIAVIKGVQARLTTLSTGGGGGGGTVDLTNYVRNDGDGTITGTLTASKFLRTSTDTEIAANELVPRSALEYLFQSM